MTTRIITALLVGMAPLALAACGSGDDMPTSESTTDEATAVVTTAASLEQALATEMVRVDTEAPMQIEDVDCRITPETNAVSGAGFWLCSYRDLGDPQSYIYLVEVRPDGYWQTSSSLSFGEVADLSDDEVAAVVEAAA